MYQESRLHEASQDGQPYVYVTYANPNDYKAGADRGPQSNPFGANMMAFMSPEDLMKNLPKAMSNIGKAMGGDGGFPLCRVIVNTVSGYEINQGNKCTEATRAAHLAAK